MAGKPLNIKHSNSLIVYRIFKLHRFNTYITSTVKCTSVARIEIFVMLYIQYMPSHIRHYLQNTENKSHTFCLLVCFKLHMNRRAMSYSGELVQIEHTAL